MLSLFNLLCFLVGNIVVAKWSIEVSLPQSSPTSPGCTQCLVGHPSAGHGPPQLLVQRRNQLRLGFWISEQSFGKLMYNENYLTAASRDHVVSHHPESGIVFISGGKWTTYREMSVKIYYDFNFSFNWLHYFPSYSLFFVLLLLKGRRRDW